MYLCAIINANVSSNFNFVLSYSVFVSWVQIEGGRKYDEVNMLYIVVKGSQWF